MKPIIALFAALACANAGLAEEAAARTPRLTGQEFMQHYFDQVDIPILAREESALINHQFAEGYLAGVAANTQGKEWCVGAGLKRAAIQAEVTAALRRLPPERLREEASALIVDILRREFPCPAAELSKPA